LNVIVDAFKVPLFVFVPVVHEIVDAPTLVFDLALIEALPRSERPGGAIVTVEATPAHFVVFAAHASPVVAT
jgi:hypothetical protein